MFYDDALCKFTFYLLTYLVISADVSPCTGCYKLPVVDIVRWSCSSSVICHLNNIHLYYYYYYLLTYLLPVKVILPKRGLYSLSG